MALDRDQILERLADGGGDLSGLDLSGADLSRLDLRGVNLSRADLSSADLRWAVLEQADLHSSVLRRADARWAIFRGANLRQADLGRANLGWSDITGADLTGANLDGTNLENVNLGEGIVERRVSARDWVLAGVPGRLALPRAGPALLAAGVVALVVVHLWGWLYHRAYYGAFGLLDQPGIVGLSHGDNFTAGLLKVLLLVLKSLLASPLVVIALAVLAGLVGALTAALVLAGEKLLERVEVAGRQARPTVVVALVVVYALLFFFLIDRTTAWAGEHWGQALPGDRGLRAIADLAAVGGLVTKAGFLVVLAATGVLLWTGYRWLSWWLAGYELPTRWRLRYPALESALEMARRSPLFTCNAPLTAQEQQRALYAAVGGLLVWATLLSGVGRVYALYDMCDGGDLPRIQLYTNRTPTTTLEDAQMCQRQVAETDSAYYVFFPTETMDGSRLAARQARWTAVERQRVVLRDTASGPAPEWCTCESGPRGDERVLIDPDEVVVEGVIQQVTGDLLLLEGTEMVGTVQLAPTTTIVDAEGQVTSDRGVLKPRLAIRATGYLSRDGTYLEAQRVVVVPAGEAQAGPAPELEVDLSEAPTIRLRGQGWTPGSQINIGLAPIGVNAPQIPLGTGAFVVDETGSFDAPITIPPGFRTGPEWQVVARDPVSGDTATGPWLAEPLPTATPTATRIRPTTIAEITPVAAQTPARTATAPVVATNTPFPSVAGPAAPGRGPGPFECQGDEFETDWPRGYEKEIYVSFSETGVTQSHNFCPTGDIDLAYFWVKKGRWYRVFTSNLAPGVDTVMAVGDLSNSTPCQPAGCWNDDRGPLTYESEIVFQAVEDDRAIITIDNRGSHYGDDATYELGVVEFIPTPTPTATPAPSVTPSATPTPTRTPLPLVDYCESNDSCRFADNCRLRVGQTIEGVLDRGSDEDWYRVEADDLLPGTYALKLLPPVGQDYDVQLREIVRQSTNECPLVDVSLQGRNRGDLPEEVRFEVVSATDLVVRVFTPYSSVYGDPHNYYYLSLERLSLSPTATLTPTSTATGTPSATPTVTATASPTPTANPSASTTATAATPTGTAGAATGTPTGTAVPTTTVTATASPTPAANPTVTATSTSSPVPSPTATP